MAWPAQYDVTGSHDLRRQSGRRRPREGPGTGDRRRRSKDDGLQPGRIVAQGPVISAQPTKYPSLLQINTRVWLTELSRSLGRRATLDDIPDAELDRLAREGFDWIWMLSVWQTGPAGQRVSRSNPEWRKEFAETLPDLQEEDIAGSGFAITSYAVHAPLGGDAALARLRDRLRKRRLKLMLDFVPNHTGLDHPWAQSNPDTTFRGRKPISIARHRTSRAADARMAAI